jgi:thioester reductase-like protein
MVPSRLIAMDKMPMTATNKIDMMALRKIAESGEMPAEEKVKEPVAVSEPPAHMGFTGKVDTDYVLSVWNRVLTSPVSDSDVSFFDCGGSSMAALNVLSHYYNDKLEMSLSQFYENPTARAQAQLLGAGGPPQGPDAGNSGKSDAESEKTESTDVRDVLVSGATGFFGSHIIAALTSKPGGRVICLLRDGSKDRLKERLEWYFGADRAEKILERVDVIKGDLSEKYLGMYQGEITALCERIGEIYHCAADVRHYCSAEEEYIRTNVDGTSEMIELARKSGAKLYHMSTCSVSGDVLKNGGVAQFTENDFDIGQVWQSNIYVKSKFLAEKAVFDAIAEGLDAKIFRLGRLVGRETDGKFQIDPESNMFYLIMKAIESVGALPEEAANCPWDFMPIDMAAEEVLLLKDADGSVFHIMNPEPPTLGEIFTAMCDSAQILPAEEFVTLYTSKAPNMLPAHAALIRMHISDSECEPKINVTCSLTTQALQRAGYTRSIRSLKETMRDFRKGE